MTYARRGEFVFCFVVALSAGVTGVIWGQDAVRTMTVCAGGRLGLSEVKERPPMIAVFVG